MSKAKYVLEVCEFNMFLSEIKHIGYMKGKFKTKKDAVSYYDRHNPHMRSLNAHNTYISDWDPNTKLLYIVRDDYLINMTIDCFSIEDNTEIESPPAVGSLLFGPLGTIDCFSIEDNTEIESPPAVFTKFKWLK